MLPRSEIRGKPLQVPVLCRRVMFFLPLSGTALLLAGCGGIQSALDPAGEEAQEVAKLFWVMTAGFAVIWAGVVLLALHAARWKRQPVSEKAAGRLIFWGGAVFPVTVLTLLLTYALWLMPGLRPFVAPSASGLEVEVVGHQFWWHVVYRGADGREVISANEIRLPAGERVSFTLRSADMIHSFWVPVVAGKMDLIPGRTNRLSVVAKRPGTYRGQCAEFCGTSHALMAFPAVVMAADDFRAWLSARSAPSAGLDASAAGASIFRDQNCGACHRVSGTEASGTSGPDLSHVGSRLSIGAGLLANSEEEIARFVSHSGLIKPGSRMPAYAGLPSAAQTELARWLKALQ